MKRLLLLTLGLMDPLQAAATPVYLSCTSTVDSSKTFPQILHEAAVTVSYDLGVGRGPQQTLSALFKADKIVWRQNFLALKKSVGFQLDRTQGVLITTGNQGQNSSWDCSRVEVPKNRKF